ncbi:hypothetical protein Tco_1465780 [Tanacetum coccineum]
MTTLADKSLLSGGDNKPPMLEKHLYDSWKSRMELYMMNRPHGRMILASVEKGPLVWPSITEDGVTRLKEYVELTPAEAIQAVRDSSLYSDLDNSTSNVLIPLDSWTSGLLVYRLPLSGKMDNPNLTMEEYVRLEEEKARKHGKVFNWQTATYGQIRIDDDLYDLSSMETEFPAIVIDDDFAPQDTLQCKSQVSTPVNDEIEFRISFDESDDEDCTVIFDKKSFSYKIISVNNLKMDSENDNDKVNMPSFPPPEPTISCFDDLEFFKDFKNEFPAIVYNDAQTSKSDLLTEPILNPQHIDEFNLKNKTSLSECGEKEQNFLNFNDLFPFNVIYPNDSKSDKDNDDDKFEGVTDWYQSQGYREPVTMSSATSAVTYTSVNRYETRQSFLGADYEDEFGREAFHGCLPVPQNEDVRPYRAIDSPTTESPGYITESDPEEDPEEYEDDETEDGPVDYPMDGGDDGDDDDGDSSRDDARDEDEDEEDEEDEEEVEHLAPAVLPSYHTPLLFDEPVFPT